MRTLRRWLSPLVFTCFTLALTPFAEAQQLTTFVDGTPALAAQVNGNFSALVAEINTLKAQVAALQANGGGSASSFSIVGTWDEYFLESASFSTPPNNASSEVHGSGGGGTITFRADGTYSGTSSSTESALNIARGIPPGSNAVQMSISTNNGSSSDSGTWSLVGNTITLTNSGGSGTARVSADGNVLISRSTDGGRIGISVAIKR